MTWEKKVEMCQLFNDALYGSAIDVFIANIHDIDIQAVDMFISSIVLTDGFIGVHLDRHELISKEIKKHSEQHSLRTTIRLERYYQIIDALVEKREKERSERITHCAPNALDARSFDDITAWQNETFGQSNAMAKANHLAAEVIELITAIKRDDELNAAEEIADCIILLFGTASKLGLTHADVCRAVDTKMQTNKKRTWGTPDQFGVVNHIKQQS